jgi:hypothetical protein
MNHITLAVAHQEAMNHFIVIILALAFILVVVLALSSKSSAFHRFMSKILEDEVPQNEHKSYLNGMKKKSRGTRTELVMLVQKIDERKRISDARGHYKLFNEYYELIFRTKSGEPIHIITNKEIFRQVPFNQQGYLSFRRDEFVKFRSKSGTIEDAPKHDSK